MSHAGSMVPNLVACPSCSSHVKRDEVRCPYCSRALRDAGGRIGITASALLMGLTLGGCGEKDDDDDSTSESASVSTSAEPEYGVVQTEGEPDYGVATTGDSTSTTGTDESSTTMIGEPEYGVPQTTSSTGSTG